MSKQGENRENLNLTPTEKLEEKKLEYVEMRDLCSAVTQNRRY